VVIQQLTSRGWSINETKVGNRPVLHLTGHGVRRQARVSARSAGTWQTSTSYGQKQAAPETAGRVWVFVDLIPAKAAFYVVPEGWMVEDIDAHHQEYLERHGGVRKLNRKSTHHAIRLDRIDEWRDRWDLLIDG